jgi:hypothetical protein
MFEFYMSDFNSTLLGNSDFQAYRFKIKSNVRKIINGHFMALAYPATDSAKVRYEGFH